MAFFASESRSQFAHYFARFGKIFHSGKKCGMRLRASELESSRKYLAFFFRRVGVSCVSFVSLSARLSFQKHPLFIKKKLIFAYRGFSDKADKSKSDSVSHRGAWRPNEKKHARFFKAMGKLTS